MYVLMSNLIGYHKLDFVKLAEIMGEQDFSAKCFTNVSKNVTCAKKNFNLLSKCPFFKSRNSDLRHLIHYYFQTFICIIFHFCFRNLSQGSSDTGFFGSMEKDKKQRRQRSVFCEAFSRDFYCKK